MPTLIDGAGGGKRLGACLDSCHLLASGYDIRTAEGLSDVLDDFDRVVGLDRLGTLHVNDSKTPLGSNVDRHINLGDGELGRKGCAAFLSEPRFEGLPCVFEGPGAFGKGVEKADIDNAWKLRKQGLRRAQEVTVRPARPEDVDAVLALWGGARSAHAVTEDTPERVAALLRAGALLVAEVDGEVVGAVIAAFDGWRGNFYRLAVAPAHRRRGIAARLVAAGEERLRGGRRAARHGAGARSTTRSRAGSGRRPATPPTRSWAGWCGRSRRGGAIRLGIADHLGWAIAVTVSAEHEVVDRRRIALIEPGISPAPLHYESARLDVAATAALVAEARVSIARAASAELDDLAAALPAPVLSISLRTWPHDFPDDIAVQRRAPYESRADAIMYRQELSELAHARDWEIHLYDAKAIEGQAAVMLGERAGEVLHGPRATLGPPWTRDHRVALAAAIVAGERSLAAGGGQQRDDHVADRRRDAVARAAPGDDAVAGVPLERAAGFAVGEDRGAGVVRQRGEPARSSSATRVREVGALGAGDGERLARERAGEALRRRGGRTSPARRPVSAIRPATALTASLRQAWVTKSSASSTPSSRAATASAAGSARQNEARRSLTTRTWPGPTTSVASQTTAGRTVAPRHVAARQLALLDAVLEHGDDRLRAGRARQEPARASVWCALTASSTTSACHGTAAGSVSTGPGTTSSPTTSRSSGVRPHSTQLGAGALRPSRPRPRRSRPGRRPRRGSRSRGDGRRRGPEQVVELGAERAVAAGDLVASPNRRQRTPARVCISSTNSASPG